MCTVDLVFWRDIKIWGKSFALNPEGISVRVDPRYTLVELAQIKSASIKNYLTYIPAEFPFRLGTGQ